MRRAKFDQNMKTKDASRATPFVSVIIPARNEEIVLPETLKAVFANEYPQDCFEVLVIDNGSEDATAEIAREVGASVHRLDGVNVGAVRNFGVEKAKGEYLAFLDADCIPDADWLSKGVAALQEERCIAGSTYDVPEEADWIEKTWFSQREHGRVETTHINAGNLFVARELFFEIGGFDASLPTGEDTEFCTRARAITRIISDERVRVVHLGNPRTLRDFIRREIWYGLGALGTYRINPFDKPLIGTVVFAIALSVQIASICGILMGYPWQCGFALGSSVVAMLLVGTVLYRWRFTRTWDERLRLLLLYYFFYLGRAISFIYILTGSTFYHGIEKAALDDQLEA